MLACVPGKNQAPSDLGSLAKQVQHLSRSNLAGFVNDDDATLGDGLLEEEGSDGRRCWQTRGLEINDLLALRRGDAHRTIIEFENSGQFTQDIALASPGATAKQRDKVARR